MPSPKKCGSQYPQGSRAYNDCVNYAGQKEGVDFSKEKQPMRNAGSKPARSIKGRDPIVTPQRDPRMKKGGSSY